MTSETLVHTQPNQESQELTRRSFLKMGMGALGVLAALEIGGASLLFLQARTQEGQSGGLITAGETESFPPGSVTEFPAEGFFLVRAHDGGFLAVDRRCPHLGCIVEWVPEKNHFLCPCHASTFDFHGDYENPPVPRPLDTFAVQFKGNVVLVDTSRLQQREHYAPDQLVYA
ncbi:MAG: ubiquinol-cytochrome c reductase iron-sulfur subunit [Chloroflexota bacterium]